MGGKGSGGKNRLPRKFKVIRGTFRKDRNPVQEPEPTKVTEVPTAPAYLGHYGKSIWKKIAEEMVTSGVLTVVDLPAMELLCTAYEDFREARDIIRISAKGKPRTARQYFRGKNSQTMPEYAAMKSARAEYKAFAVEFGLTASSRNRIDLKPPKQPELDPMEDLISKG